MRPPKPRALAALLLPLALLAGCSSDSGDDDGRNTDATRVFAADNGDITIPADPQRVIATGYAVPALIEADAALVGISSWERGRPLMTDEDRATYDELPRIAGENASETNYEAIAAQDPDLIVIGVPAPVLGDIDMERLESIAPVVAIGPTIPSAWRELSERQADAAGRLEHFEEARDAYEQRAAELTEKYADTLAGLDFGHVGSYGDAAAGTFMREYADAWGTNIAGDIGVSYPGEPAEPGEGSAAVSEYPSIEELPESLGDADVITYSVGPDGTPNEAVNYVLESELWQNLPAVQAGRAIPLRYTEAATYASALRTLDAIDEALTPLLEDQ
ncbi:ABC transporter substrate-binding protein [Streptomyces sp. RFCAC02]|uniref:ABC transporter substrate-binding protein n=1 Tax=Streptomyces sp. RFCAC02 TaxID=2499143 RepID=UPI001021B9EC|nr:ABC transporter substrate-binding protein [Streptomyces sp. RFCAC02]